MIIAQLFCGRESKTDRHIKDLIKSALCISHPSHEFCIVCTDIDKDRSHSVCWLSVDETYIRDSLQPIFDRIVYLLDPHQRYFFVVPHAERLNAVSANSLLKVIEEPPAGYQFLFSSQRPSLVLPTIRSRCAVVMVDSSDYHEKNESPLFMALTSKQILPTAFLKIIDKQKLKKYETEFLLEQVLYYWFKQPRNELSAKILKKLLLFISRGVPVSSSKLILKDLYLTVFG